MATHLIDVWNVETFDEDVLRKLRARAELVRSYIATEWEILESEASGLRPAYRSNPHSKSYHRLLEDLDRDMETRTIRAWHYTRLTDAEVEAMRATGIDLSSLGAIRQRLDMQVAAKEISAGTADALYGASPFHHPDQIGPRSDKFWMTSHPVEIGDGRVTLFLRNWGGEGVYFWLNDEQLKTAVANIGKPRVIEVAVPLDATNRAYLAGKAVVATFARSLGCMPDFGAFDLYARRALGPDTILEVHTEGEAAFAEIGKVYPQKFRQ
jgi:hypothetical protein